MSECEALERLLRSNGTAADEEHEDDEQGEKPKSEAQIPQEVRRPESRNSVSLNHRLEKERPANHAGHESKPCR
jgi:hypothetical protein